LGTVSHLTECMLTLCGQL